MTTNDVEVLRGEIISIGTEILLGALTDTNANYLASQLPAIGIGNYRVTTVGDNQDRLARVFQEAWNRSDIIVATGGLGPTEDDVTREAIAQFMGEELYSDPTLEKELREFFDRRGIAMAERNLKQTMLIPSAQPLANPRGTAPGWWVQKDGKVIVSMPGVPREMYGMWEDQAVPRLRALLMGRDAVIHSRTIKTFGLSEASVDERLGELLRGLNPTIGVYAKSDGIHIRLTARASTETDAAGLITPVEDEVNDRLSAHLWGQDADTLEAVIQRIYTERGLSVATMESCTGGNLANILTDAPGASAFFRASYVTYTNEMKIAMGVPADIIEKYGAVSGQCAIAMADAARERSGATVGVGITGVAGPGELEGKPAGLAYIGISDERNHKMREGRYPAQRLDFKLRVTRTAMFELRGWALARD